MRMARLKVGTLREKKILLTAIQNIVRRRYYVIAKIANDQQKESVVELTDKNNQSYNKGL